MTPSRDQLTARLREAWDTLRRLPSQSVPVLRSAWPQTVQDASDAYGYTPATARLSPASPRAIDRMHETFTWFRFLEDAPHLTRALWLTAGCGMGVRRAAQVLGIHRDTVRTRRDDALDRMAEGLRRTQAAQQAE